MHRIPLLNCYGGNKVILLFAFFFAGGSNFAQENNSPRTLFKSGFHIIAPIDSVRIYTLIHQSDLYRYSEPAKAISYLNQAKKLSFKINYTDAIAEIQIKLGICYAILGSFNLSKQLLKDALPYCLLAQDNNKKLLSLWYNNMATPYTYMGQNDSAMAYVLKGLKYAETLQDTTLLIRSYANIGAILINNDQFKTAIYYLEKAEQLSLEKEDSSIIPLIYYNLASSYSNLHDTSKQYYYGQKAWKASVEQDDKRIQILSLGTLGFYHLYTNDNQKAINHFNTVLDLCAVENAYHRFLPTRGLAQAYYKAGNWEKAKFYGLEAIALEAKTNLQDRSRAFLYQLMAKIYHESGDNGQAYRYQNQYIQFNDSLLHAERNNSIDQLQVKYQVSEKDREIAEKKLQLDQQKNHLKSRNTWIIVSSAGTVLLGILLLSFFHSTRRKLHILKQRDEINTLKAVMKGEEQERNRIAKELHDGIAGLVSAASINLNNLGDEYREIIQHPIFQRTELLLDEISSEVRKTAHNLMPDILLDNNLADAVRIYCAYINKDHRLNIKVQTHGNYEWINPDRILSIFRIIQELVQNILKHARATETFLQLHADDTLLSITVEDNGCGYDKAEKKSGMGLHNIEARVLSMKGTLSIETEIGVGTSVYIEFEKEKLL